MGTVVILKNADFSANAVDNLNVELTRNVTPDGFFYIGCMAGITAANWGIRKTGVAGHRVVVFDVSQYKGEKIIITGAKEELSDYSEGVHRSCIAFVTNLGEKDLDNIPYLDRTLADLPCVGLVSPSPITAGEAEASHTWETVVPLEANYLCMTEPTSSSVSSATINFIV